MAVLNVDFSTITPLGVVGLLILCVFVLVLMGFVLRSVKNIRVKTENFTLETKERQNLIEKQYQKAEEQSMNVSRDIVKKQSNLAKHHVMVLNGMLRDLISKKFDLNNEEKTIVWLLCTLFSSELKYQILNNFTENHIGLNDTEIENYSRIRAKEYLAFATSFFNDYEWTIPRFNLSECLDGITVEWLTSFLFTIYHDGKSMEKQIKGE